MAGLRLGLDAVVSAAVFFAVPVRVVTRVTALVRDDRRDGLGRVRLDEEPVQRGRGALGDGGGLVRGVGFVRVPAVDDTALGDVNTGSAAHASTAAAAAAAVADPRSRGQIPGSERQHSGTTFLSSTAACLTAGGSLLSISCGLESLCPPRSPV